MYRTTRMFTWMVFFWKANNFGCCNCECIKYHPAVESVLFNRIGFSEHPFGYNSFYRILLLNCRMHHNINTRESYNICCDVCFEVYLRALKHPLLYSYLIIIQLTVHDTSMCLLMLKSSS